MGSSVGSVLDRHPPQNSFLLRKLRPRFILFLVAKIRIPEEAMEYFRKTGAMGGKARAKKYTKGQLSEMGKKGGRPKGSGKKRTKGTTKGRAGI